MSNVLSFEQEWTRMRPRRVQIIRFIRKAIGVKEAQWSDLTKVNLMRVADYIKNRVTGNSARTYFAEICGFLRCYEEEGIVPCKHPEEVLKATKEPQQNVALTEDELHLIEDYYDKLWNVKGHKPEKDVLTLFLIEAITGARSCDVEVLSKNNIKNNMLSYVSKKTHVLATIPEHYRLRELLNRKPKQTYSSTTKNRTIKRIAKKVGITQPVTIYYHGEMARRPKYEYLGTHSARRTFISILIDRGVPVPTISKMAGHSSIEMTMRYYCSDKFDICQDAMEFFNR